MKKKTGNHRPYGQRTRAAEYLKQKTAEHCRKFGHDFADDDRCRRCGKPKFTR